MEGYFMTKTELKNKLREKYTELIKALCLNAGEDVIQTGANKIAFPVLDSEGNEEFIELTIKVPNGSRDGDPYDPWGEAEEYQMKLEAKKERAEKKKAAEEEKERKQKEREERAKQLKQENM